MASARWDAFVNKAMKHARRAGLRAVFVIGLVPGEDTATASLWAPEGGMADAAKLLAAMEDYLEQMSRGDEGDGT